MVRPCLFLSDHSFQLSCFVSIAAFLHFLAQPRFHGPAPASSWDSPLRYDFVFTVQQCFLAPFFSRFPLALNLGTA